MPGTIRTCLTPVQGSMRCMRCPANPHAASPCWPGPGARPWPPGCHCASGGTAGRSHLHAMHAVRTSLARRRRSMSCLRPPGSLRSASLCWPDSSAQLWPQGCSVPLVELLGQLFRVLCTAKASREYCSTAYGHEPQWPAHALRCLSNKLTERPALQALQAEDSMPAKTPQCSQCTHLRLLRGHLQAECSSKLAAWREGRAECQAERVPLIERTETRSRPHLRPPGCPSGRWSPCSCRPQQQRGWCCLPQRAS